MPFFKPILPGATLSDRLFACLGAAIGIALTMAAGAVLPLSATDLPLIAAPVGASAVLAFAVPASPLAQPWPVLGGNVVSALVGVATIRLIPDTALAAGLAVSGAILAMSLLRCLHPPGGAVALTAVVGGPAIHAAGWSFAVVPVGMNSLTLLLVALLFHRMSGHSFPHRPAPIPAWTGAAPADIDAALADMHESFDIAREDLDALIAHVERHAATRTAR